MITMALNINYDNVEQHLRYDKPKLTAEVDTSVLTSVNIAHGSKLFN